MAMTDISGPLAHQLPLHNHRGGLVQPSLVMNHHLDMECMSKSWYFSFFLLSSSRSVRSVIHRWDEDPVYLSTSAIYDVGNSKVQIAIWYFRLCVRWVCGVRLCCDTVSIVKSAFKLRLRMRHHNANTISGFVVPIILSSLSFRHTRTHTHTFAQNSPNGLCVQSGDEKNVCRIFLRGNCGACGFARQAIIARSPLDSLYISKSLVLIVS